MSKTLIDLPSGWRYGFPKEDTRRFAETVTQWALRNGYPKGELDLETNKVYYYRKLEVDE